MSEHKILRVWNEGERANYTYAYRCSCGHVERDYCDDYLARWDWHVNHAGLDPEVAP